MTFFLNAPNNGAFFLFVLYTIARNLCRRFIQACYDLFICELTMTRLDSRQTSLTYPDASHADASTSFNTSLDPARRLIVLVPADSDHGAMTRRIWELANATGTRVQFLGLCKDAVQEPSLRRGLVTMAALVQDGRVSTEAKVEIGTNWVEAVKRDLQTGDMIVCFAEQRAGLLLRPLSQILEANLDAPVYIISGLYTQRTSRSDWLYQIVAWTGSIGIIAGSFLLQIRLSLLPQDWAQTTLLILSVLVEIWLIGGWNSLFN